ncbi:putative integrase catalytic domain-containing protein [Phytophthora infestans]|uniref:Putative integrase catalytic domain-containing protein n=1 Tax=Phytophthora infestans TaxID=4787 RepID=A0A8S9UX61_PHYIN|nr:putative integrase catalytic domain-containing protein [Phytophthora infestans]
MGRGFKFVVTIRNISPSTALFEGQKPDVSSLKVWGCVATYYFPAQKRKGKQDIAAREALILEYPVSTTGYRVLDLISGRIVKSRYVKIREYSSSCSDKDVAISSHDSDDIVSMDAQQVGGAIGGQKRAMTSSLGELV